MCESVANPPRIRVNLVEDFCECVANPRKSIRELSRMRRECANIYLNHCEYTQYLRKDSFTSPVLWRRCIGRPWGEGSAPLPLEVRTAPPSRLPPVPPTAHRPTANRPQTNHKPPTDRPRGRAHLKRQHQCPVGNAASTSRKLSRQSELPRERQRVCLCCRIGMKCFDLLLRSASVYIECSRVAYIGAA